MAMFKLIPLMCTHVYSYIFSTMHPPSSGCNLNLDLLTITLQICVSYPRRTN